MHPTDITTFEKENGFYDYYDWRHRCPICDLPSTQCTALKLMWEDNEPAKQQDFSHRLADKAVQVQKKARNTTPIAIKV